MIIDSIDRAAVYAAISPAFAQAMTFLYEHRNGGLPDGRYPICENAYALVKRYDSKDAEQCKYEAHRDYVDVQYVVSGEEYIGWAPLANMTVDTYLEEKDQYRLSGKGALYPLHAGEYMILFPEDAHMPCVKLSQSCPVEKIILKIRTSGSLENTL